MLATGVYLLQVTGTKAGSFSIKVHAPTIPDVAVGFWGWLAKLLAGLFAPKPAPAA